MAIEINGDTGISGVNGSATTPAIQGTDTNTGLSFGTDEVNVVTGGTTRTTVDSSGRLLVGTSTSASTGLAQYSRFQIQGGTSFDAARFALRSVAAAGDGSTNDVIGEILFTESSGGPFASIKATQDAAAGSGDYPGCLRFETTADGASSPTERMRITQKGMLKVSNSGSYFDANSTAHEILNTTSNQNVLRIINSSATPYGSWIYFSNTAPDNNSNYFLRCEDNVADRLFIYSDGDVWTSDAGTLSSDETLKRDITDASPKLADVMNLRVRNFYWREDYHPNKQDKKLIGFVAQEFEEVFPGLVSDHKIKGGNPIFDEDGNDTGETTPEVYKKGIKEGKLIPILVKALQEAVERIETLETRVAQLEGGTN